jgi:sucrose-phosphate synthase
MHIAFLNPQGNFDARDRYWTEHPDFGGQLVYVKQVAIAMASLGHTVDILTRRIIDVDWPEFAQPEDRYPEAPNVRILRLSAGPDRFLRKELLWQHLARDWVPNILTFYRHEGAFPDAFTAHYADGGLSGALIEQETGIPFTWTGHSLGAQKMDQLGVTKANLAQLNAVHRFTSRIFAERLSMNRSAVNITSTRQERFEQYAHHVYRDAIDVHDDRRFAVIAPGVNLQIFGHDIVSPEEEATHAHVRVMLARDIDADRLDLPAIVASSRLDPKKNHIGLVQAFAQTPELQARANLVLFTGALNDPLRDSAEAGEPVGRPVLTGAVLFAPPQEDAEAGALERGVLEQIREVVEQHHLWGKVSAFALRGQPALAAAYRFLARRGSVFALTSHYEPFGLAPLEAAAAGLPLVVTRNGGPSESLRSREVECAVFIDPTDPKSIAQGLLGLLADQEAWATFRERGQRRVWERYTWERTAEGYLTQIGASVFRPTARRPDRLLPIHPFLQAAGVDHEGALEELAALYFIWERDWG